MLVRQHSDSADGLSFMKETYRLNNDLFDSLIFITVKVHDEDILVLFDTGASISIISQSLAKRFDFQTVGWLTAGNNNGKLFTIEKGHLNGLEICGLPIENSEVGIVPDNYLDFGVDEKGRAFPARMLLGWDIISRFYWRIDTKNKLYSVSKRSNKKTNNLSYFNFPAIKLNYKTECMLFGLDTGHTETLLDESWRFKLNNLQPVEDEFNGVGGSSVEQSFVADNLEIFFGNEKICLKKATVLRHPIYGLKNNRIVGLLGMDFFENSVFEIDYGNRYFHIEKYD